MRFYFKLVLIVQFSSYYIYCIFGSCWWWCSHVLMILLTIYPHPNKAKKCKCAAKYHQGSPSQNQFLAGPSLSNICLPSI